MITREELQKAFDKIRCAVEDATTIIKYIHTQNIHREIDVEQQRLEQELEE